MYTRPTPTGGRLSLYNISPDTAVAMDLWTGAISVLPAGMGASTGLAPFGLDSQYRRLGGVTIQSPSHFTGLVKPRALKYAISVSVCSLISREMKENGRVKAKFLFGSCEVEHRFPPQAFASKIILVGVVCL